MLTTLYHKITLSNDPADAGRVWLNNGVSGSEHRIARDRERTNNSVLLISGINSIAVELKEYFSNKN